MVGTQSEGSADRIKRTARLAGACYVALGVAATLGFYHAPLLRSDLDTGASLLAVSDLRFRIGVVADVLAAVLAVPLAVLLYEVFVSVNRRQAALMATLLVVAVPISFVVALDYVAARWLLSAAPVAADLASAERQALGMLFLHLHRHGVLAVEVFWGLWLLPFGWLVIRSRLLPRVLGVLLIVGGVAYVAHSATSLLSGGQRIAGYEPITMVARAAAEFPTMLWLLIKGADAHGVRKVAD